MVDPLADRTNFKKTMQPVKLLSVEGLKKALRFVLAIIDMSDQCHIFQFLPIGSYGTFLNSNAGKVTTNAHSQGIRFLTEITGLRSLRTS